MMGTKRLSPPYWLASNSPRRRIMLEEAGIPIIVKPADIDDGQLVPGRIAPEQWVMAMAHLKARRVVDILRADADHPDIGTVIGADTVCVNGGEILGQPRDADDARRMIRMMINHTHITMTGVALLSLDVTNRLLHTRGAVVPPCTADETISQCVSPRTLPARLLFVDRTRVFVGRVSDEAIESYVASGEWRGKAGAYNLSERIDAGWPIEIDGDPTTVMGLPMRRLLRLLDHAAERTP